MIEVASAQEAQMLLSARGVCKAYGGVEVLHGVSVEFAVGERHAIVGENGAGKSTLVRIISGVVKADAGEVRVEGALLAPGLEAARCAGVVLVHQELSLVPTLSIAENCVLGVQPSRFGFVRRRDVYEAGRRALELVGLTRDPGTAIEELSFAERQLVELGRALLARPRLLILDEPTSALSPGETERLFGLLRRLNAEHGTTIVYISHRVAEVFALCDTATVLRDGKVVGRFELAETSSEALVKSMVGRQLDLLARRKPLAPEELGAAALETRDLHGPGVRGISLTIRGGEVCGVAGLVGAGRSEFARLLAGLERSTAGSILINGREGHVSSPRKARGLGIAFVPEDRQREGLALALSCGENAVAPSLRLLSRRGWLRKRQKREFALQVLTDNAVRPAVPEITCGTLSGGNQQKVALGKWLPTMPSVLILDEPTRGVDVKARSEIHLRIDALTRSGTAVLLISSDLPELLTLSDRIVVIREGRLVGEIAHAELSEERVIALAAGERATA